MKRSQGGAEDERSERPTIPAPPPPRARSGPVLRPPPEGGGRSLRHAVILLTEKLERMGIDCSDVTEMLGIDDDRTREGG